MKQSLLVLLTVVLVANLAQAQVGNLIREDDFADLDKSLFITSTGQSGNVLSPQYSDQADMWVDAKYLQMTTKPADYQTGALGTGMFSPKRN